MRSAIPTFSALRASDRESCSLAKYNMINHPIRDLCQRLIPHHNSNFVVNATETLVIRKDECPEELGDELRLWCRRHCNGRWKHTVRGVRGIIAMGFESALDAAMFRASALNDCRTVIAANNRRRHAIMRRASR